MGQGVLPQHYNCTFVRMKGPGVGDSESFLSIITVPMSGGKYPVPEGGGRESLLSIIHGYTRQNTTLEKRLQSPSPLS